MIASAQARLVRAAVAMAALVLFVSWAAAEPIDPFSDDNAVNKVFAKKDKAGPVGGDATSKFLRFKVKVEPEEVKRGQTFKLTITGTLAEGFHTYPVRQRSEDPLQKVEDLTQLKFDATPGLQPLEPFKETDADLVERPDGVFAEFNKEFTWSQDILVLPDAAPGVHKIPFSIKVQVCNDKVCVPGRPKFEPQIKVSDAPAVALTPEIEERQKETAAIYEIEVPKELKSRMSTAKKAAAKTAPAEAPKDKDTPPEAAVGVPGTGNSLLGRLLLTMLGGFAMLLTPCVFPMIPVTVSFFIKQGEKEHHRPFTLAFVYSGTIVVVLTAAVLILGNIIITLASNPWLNLGMGVILMLFALSLFGMFEMELPHFLVNFTSSRESQGGYLGAFFMALTFTINSFTCTGPFLGPLLSGVADTKMSPWELAVVALVYSTAFAAPFFVLALFPRLLKMLPRSGGWLNAVKVVMGFIEVALAMKFLSITDAKLFPGQPRFFNYDTVLCTWMALSVACGLYLLGIFRLPHDTPEEHVGVPRLMLATFFLGLAVYMTPLLDRKTPLGTVGENIQAMLPQDNRAETPAVALPGQGSTPVPTHLAWLSDYQQAWEKARAEKKLLFIDFTGINCANCRKNEQSVFPRRDVREELSKFVLVQLYLDGSRDSSLTREQADKLADRNLNWQARTFRDNTMPMYVILDVSHESVPVTEDGKLTGIVKGFDKQGTITDVPGFVAMMQKAQGK